MRRKVEEKGTNELTPSPLVLRSSDVSKRTVLVSHSKKSSEIDSGGDGAGERGPMEVEMVVDMVDGDERKGRKRAFDSLPSLPSVRDDRVSPTFRAFPHHSPSIGHSIHTLNL